MGLASFNRRRELEKRAHDSGIMQGEAEIAVKADAAAKIDRGEIPNPVDGTDPYPSTNRLNPGTRGFGPSRRAEAEYLAKYGVDGTEGAHPSSVPLNRGGAAVERETHSSLPDVDPYASVDTPGAKQSTVKRDEDGETAVNVDAMTAAELKGVTGPTVSGGERPPSIDEDGPTVEETGEAAVSAEIAEGAGERNANGNGNGGRKRGRPRKEG